MYKIKRIYEKVSEDDGKRVLIDRIWPRGISREKAQLDEWLKEIAPSTELRKWFRHQPEKFEAFKEKYRQELQLAEKRKLLNQLIQWEKETTVTLLYAAKDEEHNQAIVLKKRLEEMSAD
ncbi:uncharacterized protein YeaO (DUF488 family) [Oikeobacillus pervagus]|uniref:Uncharacterized protein YeaO (DUF488 family) n=1 Tax=Oikeobacillus pervagus TaxID=1325931 RepID=A0AAJ1T4K2_9BACI|nr:DUF488 family protein [Oikeobacillus pervagus]MDQ0216506.1 uncharacterized protein YeaO (DUF488 family) [Oikeobacillus pervagus]